MKLTLSNAPLNDIRVDLLAIPVSPSDLTGSGSFHQLDLATNGALHQAAKLEDFNGKSGEILRVHVAGIGAQQVLLVGMGDDHLHPRNARILAARAAQAAFKCSSAAIALPSNDEDSVRAAAEGVITGAYRYTAYLTGERVPKRNLEQVFILTPNEVQKGTQALERGQIIGEAITLVRDLVNAPPNE
ncbi:MAG: hypothetical protein N2515_08745, partial [Deltaproteobacteria bacterium]|nr:hypothetical protein [Deltaproteobacteria bacterium]